MWWLIAAVAVSAPPLDIGEGMCGVWGYLPPFLAMLAMHLHWAVALGSNVHLIPVWQPTLLRPFGTLLFAAALAAAVRIAGSDLVHRVDRVPEKYHAFWPKRVSYTLATHIDLPLVQGMIAGLVLGGRPPTGLAAKCVALRLGNRTSSDHRHGVRL